MRDNAEDYDLWLRMIDAGYELANIPEVFVRYRTSIQSSSQIFQDSIAARFVIFIKISFKIIWTSL